MSFGGQAILKRYKYILLCGTFAGCLALNQAWAQDSQDAADTPPAAISTPDNADDMDLESLEATLPAHLRTPLPVKQKAQGTNVTPRDINIAATDDVGAPPSAIESFYRKTSGDQTLTQFGYSFFADADNAGKNDSAPDSGTVQDNYVLGAGDRLNISFLGERKDKATYTIDQSGTLAVDLLPPLAAAGKTLGDLRRDIRHLLDAQMYHGDVYIALESIRQLGVLVAGQVANPGRHALTPLQTVLEAIEDSGGVLKNGSLRQIRLVREGATTIIDLYTVITGAQAHSTLPTLREGDRIIVPTLGPTVAVTGDVRQPAIYELPAGGNITTKNLITLSGGLLSRGQNRLTLMTPQGDGRRTAIVVTADSDTKIQDGAILAVNRTDDRMAASFTLTGETRSPGTYALAQYDKLSKALHSAQAFGDNVYPLMGVISRRMARGLAHDLIAFSPQDIFTGHADMDLEDGDAVILLSRSDVRDVLDDKKTQLEPLVATFVREHAVSIQGAVRLSGSWPVAGPVPVAKLLDVAGGALSDADLARVEINRNDVGLNPASTAISHRDTIDLSAAGADQVTVTFGDAVRIPDRFEAVTRQSVVVQGEVRNPGTYDLMRGDTLLTLIDRAGGMTDQAYPLGTVFSRAAERKREKEKFSSAARDLERAIALAAKDDNGKVNMEQVALAKDLVDELKTIEPAGRITVESDPGILRRDPAQDILLESGDKIYVPKRPLSVRVTGEVLSPAALQFRADKDIRDYLAEAGGLTLHADKGRMFVLTPNGSAQPLGASSWTKFTPLMITPGSTIVVPRDPKPFDFIESAKDITQILSNLAITGIYAEDVVDRNK